QGGNAHPTAGVVVVKLDMSRATIHVGTTSISKPDDQCCNRPTKTARRLIHKLSASALVGEGEDLRGDAGQRDDFVDAAAGERFLRHAIDDGGRFMLGDGRGAGLM